MTMYQRERVAAVKGALEIAGAKEFRLPMSTADAAKLAAELQPDELRHPEQVAIGLKALDEVASAPSDPEAAIAHGVNVAAAANKFWDGFEQQIVDGVEIIRKR
jgi:hypothetical protein